jgi:hypothetical protein
MNETVLLLVYVGRSDNCSRKKANVSDASKVVHADVNVAKSK